MPEQTSTVWYETRWVRAIRLLLSLAAVVTGLGIIVLTMSLGHCSFVGDCQRAPAFDSEVFWSSASGAVIAVGVPVYLSKPSWKRLMISLVSAGAVAAIVGFAVVYVTAGR